MATGQHHESKASRGRPKGSRTRVLFDLFSATERKALARKLYRWAMEGDKEALKLIVERLWGRLENIHVDQHTFDETEVPDERFL